MAAPPQTGQCRSGHQEDERDCHQQVARLAARWPAVSLPIGDTIVTSAIAFAAPRLHQIDDQEHRER